MSRFRRFGGEHHIKFTLRTISAFAQRLPPPICSAVYVNGRIRPCHKNQARTPAGIKYNRLVRLRYRITGGRSFFLIPVLP